MRHPILARIVRRVVVRVIERKTGMNPLDVLSGYKTYIAAVGLVALGVYQLTQGDLQTGAANVVTGLGLIFNRRAADRPQ